MLAPGEGRPQQEDVPVITLTTEEVAFIKQECARITAHDHLLPFPVGLVRDVPLVVSPGESLNALIQRIDRCAAYGILGQYLHDARREGGTIELTIDSSAHFGALVTATVEFIAGGGLGDADLISFTCQGKKLSAGPSDLSEAAFWAHNGGKPRWLK